jgi:propionyl-CoA carboxylase alpha chain
VTALRTAVDVASPEHLANTEAMRTKLAEVETEHAKALIGREKVSAAPAEVVLDIKGLRRTFRVGRHTRTVVVDSPLGSVTFTLVPAFTDPADAVAAGSLLAPMPGSVVRLGTARVGDVVKAGQPILWLEAMKMEHQVTAPVAGVLGPLPVSVGSQVDVGTALAVVEEGEAA